MPNPIPPELREKPRRPVYSTTSRLWKNIIGAAMKNGMREIPIDLYKTAWGHRV